MSVDWCRQECVGTERWVQCNMSVDWCREECVGTERWVQCDMSVDWCREECVGPWQGEFMCSYCLQRKVVLIVETKVRIWRLECSEHNFSGTVFAVVLLLLLCIGQLKPVCVAQGQKGRFCTTSVSSLMSQNLVPVCCRMR